MSVEYLIFVDFISIFQANAQGEKNLLRGSKKLFRECHDHYARGGWKNQFKNALI